MMGAPWAEIGAGVSKTAGQTGAGLADWIGGDMAARALKRSNQRARTDLMQGYSQAQGYQQPIYDTALGNYQSLSNAYAGGQFQNPHMDPYQFNPQSVFQDPESQAQMRAGSEAVNRNAQTSGNLFSGINDRDLTQFGQDLFSRRSDALYNRGFNAQNTAFNQNMLGNQQNFNQGYQLMNPLAGSANQLTDLSVMQGADLANNDLGAGVLRANNINNTAGAIGKFSSQQGENGADFFNSFSLGKGKKSLT